MAAQNNFTIALTHIPGCKDDIADALSRLQISRFRQLAPDTDAEATTTPAWLTQLYHFTCSKQHSQVLPRRHTKQVPKILCPLQEIPHHSIPDHRANPLQLCSLPQQKPIVRLYLAAVRSGQLRQGWPELPKNTAQLSQLLQGLKRCARPRTRLALTPATLNQLIHGVLNNRKLSSLFWVPSSWRNILPYNQMVSVKQAPHSWRH